MNKPELLVPVGSIESFYAAIEAGADAIYLGLKNFNARKRAMNFSFQHIEKIIEIAHKKNIKVFITLNTVIKNDEISQLLDVIYFLKQNKPDALIIQDWGLYYIVKKFFPQLVLHASTQMVNHNSLGVHFSDMKGFERIILSRELIFTELTQISKKTNIQLEVFVHGALCYSFSGMCHFSSFLGGYGANRGLCTQPCRRLFKAENTEKYFFSLKDNMQISLISKLMEIGIKNFKIEGRIKPDDYVYRVTKAYRIAIDKPKNVTKALKMLKSDMGRQKTSYFLGGNLKNAITQQANTGIFTGRVIKSNENEICFNSDISFKKTYRIRIKDSKSGNQINLKVKNFTQKNSVVCLKTNKKISKNSKVFISAMPEKKFSAKLPISDKKIRKTFSSKNKQDILKSIKYNKPNKKHQLFVRINSFKWLRKIVFNKIDNLILNLNQFELKEFRPNSTFIQKNKNKIWIEFPTFIAEEKIPFYRNIVKLMISNQINKFFLSHISQKLLLPKNTIFSTNEFVYSYNDFAVKFLKSENAAYFTYPIENDHKNFFSYKYKNGIVPLFFYPKLFISRMPVKIPSNKIFYDDTKTAFKKTVIDGITYVVPNEPVSFIQYTKSFKKNGFKNFLIDLSFEKPSSNRFSSLIKRYFRSEQFQPSSNFNFKRELK